MNKGDLIEKIAAAHGISKTAAGGSIDTIIDAVTAALKKGDRVTLVGFGTFSVSQRKARNGRNPQTGGVIKIAARKVAKFTPGDRFKEGGQQEVAESGPTGLQAAAEGKFCRGFFIASRAERRGNGIQSQSLAPNLLAESFFARPNQMLWLAIERDGAIAAIDQHPLE